ncbi:MAG: hypothetical protein AAGA35_02750 [Patescibacteria group bacterium]
MKKQYFIIAGVIVITLLLAIWGYLMIFGTPQSADDIFTDFGFIPADDPTISTPPPPEPVTPEPEPVVDVPQERAQLAQLTTRAVAGYRSLATASNTIYYAELGTGHIYSIDLETGEESEVSKTTIPQAHDVHFSLDGATIVARSRYGISSDVILGRISSTTPEVETTSLNQILNTTISDYTVSENNELLYVVRGESSASGSSLDLETLRQQTLFTVPFSSAVVHWGSTATADHYVSTRPAKELPGTLYRVLENGNLELLDIRGNGLTALFAENIVLYNTFNNGVYEGYIYDPNIDVTIQSPLAALPEKCSFTINPQFVICGGISGYSSNLPNDWYQGVTKFSDSLWQLNIIAGNAIEIINLENTSGRSIDVIDLTLSSNAESTYFMNKNDNTLWAYVF